MRSLLFFGIMAGSLASVPLVYQSNPAAFQQVFRRAVERPAPPAEDAAPTEARVASLPGRRVRIDADRQGHFIAGFRLNGRSFEAVVDTGATVVAINASTARRIGLMLKPSDFVGRVSTANGETRAAPVVIDSIRIGTIEVKKVPAVVLADDALAGTLVGMSFLNRLGRFSAEDNELVLEQ